MTLVKGKSYRFTLKGDSSKFFKGVVHRMSQMNMATVKVITGNMLDIQKGEIHEIDLDLFNVSSFYNESNESLSNIVREVLDEKCWKGYKKKKGTKKGEKGSCIKESLNESKNKTIEELFYQFMDIYNELERIDFNSTMSDDMKLYLKETLDKVKQAGKSFTKLKNESQYEYKK